MLILYEGTAATLSRDIDLVAGVEVNGYQDKSNSARAGILREHERFAASYLGILCLSQHICGS